MLNALKLSPKKRESIRKKRKSGEIKRSKVTLSEVQKAPGDSLLTLTVLLTCLTISVEEQASIAYRNKPSLVQYIQKQIHSLNLQPSSFITSYDRIAQNRQFYLDPTVTVKRDVKNSCGKIIFPKRESFNPFEYFTLSQDLLFLDGRYSEHLSWAKKFGNQAKWFFVHKLPQKIIHHPLVFLDRNGMLSKNFFLQSLPARISQEGNLLKVEMLSIPNFTNNLSNRSST